MLELICIYFVHKKNHQSTSSYFIFKSYHKYVGGPLIVRGDNPEEDIEIGIVSWGTGCGDLPMVYARISEAYDWIAETVCDESDDPPNSLCGPPPTLEPTDMPTEIPTPNPTNVPTLRPTRNPTRFPTRNPTRSKLLYIKHIGKRRWYKRRLFSRTHI